MLTEKWLELRKRGIGGTDIAAIIGENPYKTPLDVYCEKLNLAAPIEENDAMKWGKVLEPIIANEVTEQTGIEWTKGEFFQKLGQPLVIGTPDYVNQDLHVGLECKTAGLRQVRDWGDAELGEDIVPMRYRIQCYWYLEGTGFDEWKLAVLIGGQDFRTYTIKRDDEIQMALVDRALKFWTDHIEKQVPPYLDGSESATKYLKARFPKNQNEIILTASEEQRQILFTYKNEKQSLKQLEERADSLQNQLKSFIGEASGIQTDGIVAKWTSNKDSTKTDWEAVAKEFQEIAELHNIQHIGRVATKKRTEEIIQKHTTTKAGARVFRLTEKK